MFRRFKAAYIIIILAMILGMLGIQPAEPVEAAGAAGLFFSEYIEGSSNNKALEIYNGTGAAVDLQAYKVVLYSNGSSTPGNTLTWATETLIADGDVYVIANASAVQAILDQADITSNVTFYNGDDAVALKRVSDDSFVDVIGQVGFAAQARSGVQEPITTVEHTLTRKDQYAKRTRTVRMPSTQQRDGMGYPQDTYHLSRLTRPAADHKDIPTELFISETILKVRAHAR